MKFENDHLTSLTEKDGLSGGGITPKMEDRSGNLWAATNDGAVIVAPDGRVRRLTTENGLSDNILAAIYEDREGAVWLGTLYHGLNRASRRAAAFYTTKDGLATNIVHPIFEDQSGDIWLGGNGLTLFHAQPIQPRERRGETIFQTGDGNRAGAERARVVRILERRVLSGKRRVHQNSLPDWE